MKYSYPKSFIQVHYHNLPGGVTTVMYRYAEIFNRLSRSSEKRNLIICNNAAGIQSNAVSEIVSMYECDYKTFDSRDDFFSHTTKLFNRLKECISSDQLPRPLCIVGHNLTLGKNIALSAAFADLADSFKTDPDVRFYSVIHDLAEEGRTDMMQRIRRLISLGIDVWRYLYKPAGAITYIALVQRNYQLFKSLGLPVKFLPNPVKNKKNFGRVSGRERSEITRGLLFLAGKDKVPFDASKPMVLCPSRVIPRKNILEAVIVACLIHNANLLVGRCGASKQDRILYTQVKNIAQKYHLPVLLDVERLETCLPASFFSDRTVFELMYDYTDVCLTTAIAEGFGYALYEPWLHNRLLIGRLPLGVAEKEIIDLTHLYQKFWIPASYTRPDKVYSLYHQKILSTYGKENLSISVKSVKKQVQIFFMRGNYLEFSALSTDLQMKVIQKIFSDEYGMNRARKDLIKANNNRKALMFAAPANDSRIKAAKRSVIKKLAGAACDKKFRGCFFINKYTQERNDSMYFKNKAVITYFSSLDRFRLLMSNTE